MPLDNHLTTLFSLAGFICRFSRSNVYYNHHNQRRKLCTPHNFRRWFIVFSWLSQFSLLGSLQNTVQLGGF
jgi:hypothetical protein